MVARVSPIWFKDKVEVIYSTPFWFRTPLITYAFQGSSPLSDAIFSIHFCLIADKSFV